MKINLIILFLLILSSASFGQQKARNIEIDPRQYIHVIYQRSVDNGKRDTIWNWEKKRIGVQNQKFRIVDSNGYLNIVFDRSGLADNRDFIGKVSLEAEITGVNGLRKIEVSPYSEVGESRMPIGIDTKYTPYELALKIVNMQLEIFNIFQRYRFQFFAEFDLSESTLAEISKFNSDVQKLDSIDRNHIRRFSSIVKNYREIVSNETIDGLDLSGNFELQDLKDYAKEMESTLQEQIKYDQNRQWNSFKNQVQNANNSIKLILAYLDSFQDGESFGVFLSYFNKDNVNYKIFKTNLDRTSQKLDSMSLKIDGGIGINDQKRFIEENASSLNSYFELLNSYFTINGSGFEEIIVETIVKSDSVLNTKLDSLNKGPVASYWFDIEFEKQKFYKNIISQNTSVLADELSKRAGEMIYKKLLKATIDLGKSGASPGEKLSLYVTWIQNNIDSARSSTYRNQPRLEIGSYDIRETGWKMEVADMFALIKRIDEESVTSSNISPTNFKGSGGVVLMWTYNREDKGFKIEQNDDLTYRLVRKNKLINFLQPSIGLNVSYLDFDTTKDVEIGTGLQVGVFSNKIFFGYGLNLHMLSPREAPTYFFLGFSFARLSDLFQSPKK